MKQLKKILYVEDNIDDRFFMKYIINKINPDVNIEEIDNGEDALNYLRTNKNNYEIIFLDIKLPKLSAFEILSILYDEKKDIPSDKICILSTSSTEKDIQQAHKYGINLFISKPIREEMLKNAINRLGFSL